MENTSANDNEIPMSPNTTIAKTDEEPIAKDHEETIVQHNSHQLSLTTPKTPTHTRLVANIKVGITLASLRASSKFIPDSEVFDLESLFDVDSPDKVSKGKGVLITPNEPQLFCYFDPPTQTKPEINFNDINVFLNWKAVENLECIDPDTFRTILMRPLQDFRPYDEMKMMTSEGEIFPCHLPFFGDLYGMSDAFFILLGWEMDNLRRQGSHRFLPESLREVIDPRPVLQLDGPVHELGDLPVRIAMGTYTDALHIMKVTRPNMVFKVRVVRSSVFVKRDDGNQRPRRWYHETVLVPQPVEGGNNTQPVETKSVIVVWSGRGVTRLLFPYHFNLIVDVYNPTVVVVVEARMSQKNLVHMMDKIHASYDCGLFGTEHFYGGVLIFWKANKVELMSHQNFHKGCKADVTIKGVANPKIRKTLFMEDVSEDKSGKEFNPV